MPRIDARLEKLEAQVRYSDEVMVYALPTESVEDCSRRRGRNPDDAGVRYTVVRWAVERDAKLQGALAKCKAAVALGSR